MKVHNKCDNIDVIKVHKCENIDVIQVHTQVRQYRCDSGGLCKKHDIQV